MSSENKEIWKKIEDYDAAEINNLSKSSISRCCKGLQKTYAGFTWKYI